MKEFLSKIAALFLAVLVLVSSSFISVDTHYCCGKIVDSSIFGKADVCEMDMVSCKTENTTGTILKDNCCYNSTVHKLGQVFEKYNLINVNLKQFNFKPHFYFTTISNLFIEPKINSNYFKDYSPPLVTKNILVLVQRFLI
jgi:hypothetical protein